MIISSIVKIVVATTNEGKLRELCELLDNSRFELLSLKQFDVNEVSETGATFAENADRKASGYAGQTGYWTLADDSGLEVKALGGAPGVRSARYLGEDSSDSENVEKVLQEVAQTKDKQRLARFACAISVSDPNGNVRFRAEGFCDGSLSNQPRGTNGFGYDPIFIPDGYRKTFGELDSALKQRLSHRAIAFKKIIEFLPFIPDS